jgi:hypothetical protein
MTIQTWQIRLNLGDLTLFGFGGWKQANSSSIKSFASGLEARLPERCLVMNDSKQQIPDSNWNIVRLQTRRVFIANTALMSLTLIDSARVARFESFGNSGSLIV